MQLSAQATRLLQAWLTPDTWSLRRVADLARWRAFIEQLVVDEPGEFDPDAVRKLIYDRLDDQGKQCGRLRDEIELRLRLATALIDFATRKRLLRSF